MLSLLIFFALSLFQICFHFLHLNLFLEMSLFNLSFARFVCIFRPSTNILGTLRKQDGDGNEDVKKQNI